MNTQTQSTFSSQIRARADQLARRGVSALGPLYDLTVYRLVRYALALTRNQHDAEDAIQAALVRVAMHPKVLARARYPWPYLVRIVRNEALLIARHRRRVQLAPMDDFAREQPDLPAQMDKQRHVWRALRKLPPLQAEVVILKIWEEMTFSEIGRVLDKSPNTVASRYQYAMAKLAGHLQFMENEVYSD